MTDESTLEWVFDSLVDFLKGPVWNIPVLTFTEQKSVVFEPGEENDEEFRKVHEHYKNLVDFMLGSYMEDIQISPEQFEKACAVASKKALNQFHQNLFEQVWAADDFHIFCRMMTQKNLELQLQALEVLAQKYGLAPDFMEPALDYEPTKEEENIMKEIIRKTIEEHGDEPKNSHHENGEGENKEEEDVKAAFAEKERLKIERQKEKELLTQAMKLNLSESSGLSKKHQTPPTPDPSPVDPAFEKSGFQNETDTDVDKNKILQVSLSPLAPLKTVAPPISPMDFPQIPNIQQTPDKSISDDDSLNPVLSSVIITSSLSPSTQTEETKCKVDNTPSLSEPPVVEASPMEIERRQNYLRQQRDRLLALKKQERKKNFENYEEIEAEKRPKSAKAARKALAEEKPEIDEKNLAFRKSLADRLKTEVVDKPV